MKKFIWATIIAAVFSSSAMAAAPLTHKQLEDNAIVQASAGVGRRVCAIHPEEEVWIYDGNSWSKMSCTVLAPIFERNATDLVRNYLAVMKIVSRTTK